MEVTSDIGTDGTELVGMATPGVTIISVVKQWSRLFKSSKLHSYKTCEWTYIINLKTDMSFNI
jgi:hypothetical protein